MVTDLNINTRTEEHKPRTKHKLFTLKINAKSNLETHTNPSRTQKSTNPKKSYKPRNQT